VPARAELLPAAIGNRSMAALARSGVGRLLLERRVDPATVRRIDQYDAKIQEVAGEHDVPAALVKGVIAAESGGQANAGARGGYKGLMQAETTADQLDPDTSIETGVKKFKQFAGSIMNKLKAELATMGIKSADLNDVRFASIVILAYNAGPGVVVDAVRAASKAGEVEKWLDEKYYVPAVLYYSSWDPRYSDKVINKMELPELLENYRMLLGIDNTPQIPDVTLPDLQLGRPDTPRLHFSDAGGQQLVDKAVGASVAKLRKAVRKEVGKTWARMKKNKRHMTMEEAEAELAPIILYCARTKHRNSTPYVHTMVEYFQHYASRPAPAAAPAATTPATPAPPH
jgi:DNA-directed RNA polymerase subunit H (RpoH/RPB5)